MDDIMIKWYNRALGEFMHMTIEIGRDGKVAAHGQLPKGKEVSNPPNRIRQIYAGIAQNGLTAMDLRQLACFGVPIFRAL
ncbi:MAG: hypothetical protein LBQ67_05170 [Treponema sp.]|jgi:hypothetical protein|nr:hypothetical protein [Treponema sp.]